MKKTKHSARDVAIVNVIDELDSSTQNAQYNSAFRKWRKNADNPFAFHFEMNKKESVYIDGRGFVNKSAAEAEHEVLGRIMNVVGIAMLIWIAVDFFAGKALVFLLSVLGVNVHTTLYDSALYGGTAEIVAALIIITSLKIIISGIYVKKRLAMPRGVSVMRTMNDHRGLFTAIALTMMICAVVSIPKIYTSDAKEVYSFFRSVNTDVSVWTQTDFITYVIFDVIVVSLLSELFFRGSMFGALRQFGDVFAICVTSIVAGLLTQDLREMPVMILISAAAGWGMLASGTMFTAVAVHIIYKLYQLALAVIEEDTSSRMIYHRSFFVAIVFTVGVLILLTQYARSGKRLIRSRLAVYHSDVGVPSRLLYAVRTFPFAAVVLICLLSSLIRILY